MPHDEEHSAEADPHPDQHVQGEDEQLPDPDSLLDEEDRSAMRRIEELRRREAEDPGSLGWREGNPGKR